MRTVIFSSSFFRVPFPDFFSVYSLLFKSTPLQAMNLMTMGGGGGGVFARRALRATFV